MANSRHTENPPIYDLLTGEVIEIPNGKLKVIFKQLGIGYTSYCHMKTGVINKVKNRYILNRDRDKIFVLINIDTNEEYQCFTNSTIFTHLGIPYNANEAKYVYELKSGRQKFASIAGSVFKMMGGKEVCRVKMTKNKSNSIADAYRLAEIKRKVKSRVHKRIWDCLASKSIKKKHSFNKLIGCNGMQFYNYIESKFTSNMGWHNRDKWHLDHIIPCDNFNLLLESQQFICFHYTNIQPIWKNNKTATEMGESNFYEGNLNKNNSNEYIYDYHAVSIFKPYLSEAQSIELAKYIFSNGIRKIIP